MRFNRLDLNLLVALDALLSLGSVSRAAEKLNMSQPAMSNALSRLRDYFGDELLVQVGRRLQPTARGLALKDAVRDMLVRVDSAIIASSSFDPTRSDRNFRISCSDFTAITLMPHLLAAAHDEGAAVSFELMPQVDHPGRALERGEADLLLIPAVYCSQNHPVEILMEESFVCVVWSGSRIADEPFGTREFMQAKHVITRPATSARSIESVFLERLGIERKIDVTSFSFAAVPHLLVGSERVATMHRRLALQAARMMPLTLLPLPFELPIMQQAMQWHEYRSADAGIGWLRSMLKEAVTRMDQVSTSP